MRSEIVYVVDIIFDKTGGNWPIIIAKIVVSIYVKTDTEISLAAIIGQD